MPDLIRDIDPDRVRERLAEVSEAAPAARVLVATKYVPDDELPALRDAGVGLVGENRLDDLVRKRERFADEFEWHFIGALQSRKVKDIVPHVRMIHSLSSESARRKLAVHAAPEMRILVQVNIAGEEGKEGIAPSELPEFLAACEFEVSGLMTMPPFTEDPEGSRPHFARLAELASEYGLSELSMGTTQDWRVAAAEGATILRLGSGLLRR